MIIGVDKKDSIGEILAVFQVLQQTCDSYEHVYGLARVLVQSDDNQGGEEDDVDDIVEQETFITNIGEDGDPAALGIPIGRIKTRTPSANLAEIMLGVLSHCKSQDVLPHDDFAVARDLVQSMYYPNDDGTIKLDSTKFRQMARRLLKAVELKCNFSDKATSQFLKNTEVPCYHARTHTPHARTCIRTYLLIPLFIYLVTSVAPHPFKHLQLTH